MKWTIGIDTKPGHQGPLEFVAWMCAQSPEEVGESVVACHVTPSESWLKRLFGGGEQGERVRSARTNARAVCEQIFDEAGVSTMLHRIEICSAETIVEGLTQAAEKFESDVLIVGRHARQDESSLIRLGSIARSCLAHYPAPMIVVPPDYVRAPAGAPILLATDLLAHSDAAADMAMNMAAHFDLPLHLVHIAKPVSWSASYVPDTDYTRVSMETTREATKRVHEWLDARKRGVAKIHVISGDETNSVAQLIASRDFSLVVVGSRPRVDDGTRYGSGMGSELASTVACPVALVPMP